MSDEDDIGRSNRCRWIGLADVRQRDGSGVLGEGAGAAFVTVVAIASDEDEFREVVSRAIEDHELRLVELTEMEPLDVRIASHSVDPVLMRDAERVPRDTAYVFGSFHVYPVDAD
jgi:hypothetical protein